MPRKPARWKQPKPEKLVKSNGSSPKAKKVNVKKAKPFDPQLSLPLEQSR